MRLAALAAVLALARPAAADPVAARLAAVAAGDDARSAILVGPDGQVYAPDGHGAWARTHAGGIGNTVVVATRAGASVLAGAAGAPPFRFDGGEWASVYLAMHAKAVVARGRRPIAAVGRQVFALDRAEPQHLPDAPAAVTAIGTGASGVAIATERGIARLDGKSWRALDRAPRAVLALASDRWAITADSAVDLSSNASTPWPHGAPAAFVADGDTLFAVSPAELLTLHATKLTVAPLPVTGTPVGLAADRDHTVVAFADGRVLVRDHDKWSTTEVRDALPAAKPGPAPALAK